jgi:hypothetical protein
MEQRKCKKCGREIYIVNDIHGRPRYLDATAVVFRTDPDMSNILIASPTNAYVEHGEVCVYGRKARDVDELARAAGYV